MQEQFEESVEPIYLIGDTETTGFPPHYEACEVALLQVHPDTLEVLGSWASLIDPEIPIPARVTAIHGITDEMVKEEPTMPQFIEYRLHGGFKRPVYLIAHNKKFDEPLLVNIGPIVGGLCTLEEARAVIHDSPNHKLQGLREHYGWPEGEAHRALADCMTTRRLLLKLSELTGRTLRQMLAVEKRVIHIMPFGAHKGTPILQMPRDYLEWLASRDIDHNLRDSVENALKVMA